MPKFFSIGDIKAKDIMNTEVVTARSDEILSELLGRMKSKNIYELPVMDGAAIVGVVSYDVLVKRRQFPLSAEARNVMVSPPVVSEDDSVTRIAEVLLSSDMRAVPVTHRTRLVGIISRSDIVRNLIEVKELANIKVDSIMTPSPTVITESDNIEKARQIMKSLAQRSVPVVDENGRLSGVIGSRDIVNLTDNRREKNDGRVAGDRKGLDINVSSVMTSPPITIGPDATLKEALSIMSQKSVSTIIVAAGNKPLGVISQSDVLEFVTAQREREGLYVNITGLDDEDPDTYDSLYGVIEKAMKRIASIVAPQMLSMHISRHNKEGDVSKHSIRVRLQTDKGLYNASTYDWDLFAATDDALRKLEKQIKKEHERFKEKPRRKIQS